MWIVAEQVGEFLDEYGLKSEASQELFGAGQLKLAQIIAKKTDASKSYVRKCVKNAILKCWQEHSTVRIKPTTRARLVERGAAFDDPEVHSWDCVFDSGGLKAGVRQSHPHWEEKEPGWSVSSQTDSDDGLNKYGFIFWEDVTKTFDALFSLCRDDDDRAILRARWDGTLESLELRPLHVDEVAQQVGLSPKQVRTRLDKLERRYYKHVNRRVPTGPRQAGRRTYKSRAA